MLNLRIALRIYYTIKSDIIVNFNLPRQMVPGVNAACRRLY